MASGGKSSGGGKSGGGNAPSGGGGGGKSGGNPTPPAPTPGPKPPTSPSGGGSSSAGQAVAAAKAYQSASTPSVGSSSSKQKENKQEQKEKKQERVQSLTEKAKGLISGATASGIADPGKFKDILGKLKDLGKDTRVENLQTKKKEAVAAAKQSLQNKPGGYTQEELDAAIKAALDKATASSSSSSSPGLTQEDLDNALANITSTGLTQEDLDTALSSYSAQNAVQKSSSDAGTSEFDDWVKSFESQQDVGAFDPDLFRNLLGELESSKYRQKEWNERSAKAAYKY